jgi:hypothetical protein
MLRAPHLDLHVREVRRVHSTLISEFPVGTHKSILAPKQWDNTTEIGRILLVRQELINLKGLNTRK